MLLVIDCGNTNTVFAVYRDGEEAPVASWRTSTVPTRTADEYAVWLTQLMALDGLDTRGIVSVIIATVVPASLFSLRTLCRKHFKIEPMVVGEPGVTLGIDVRIDRPEEVGADRVVNAVARAAEHTSALQSLMRISCAVVC